MILTQKTFKRIKDRDRRTCQSRALTNVTYSFFGVELFFVWQYDYWRKMCIFQMFETLTSSSHFSLIAVVWTSQVKCGEVLKVLLRTVLRNSTWAWVCHGTSQNHLLSIFDYSEVWPWPSSGSSINTLHYQDVDWRQISDHSWHQQIPP